MAFARTALSGVISLILVLALGQIAFRIARLLLAPELASEIPGFTVAIVPFVYQPIQDLISKFTSIIPRWRVGSTPRHLIPPSAECDSESQRSVPMAGVSRWPLWRRIASYFAPLNVFSGWLWVSIAVGDLIGLGDPAEPGKTGPEVLLAISAVALLWVWLATNTEPSTQRASLSKVMVWCVYIPNVLSAVLAWIGLYDLQQNPRHDPERFSNTLVLQLVLMTFFQPIVVWLKRRGIDSFAQWPAVFRIPSTVFISAVVFCGWVFLVMAASALAGFVTWELGGTTAHAQLSAFGQYLWEIVHPNEIGDYDMWFAVLIFGSAGLALVVWAQRRFYPMLASSDLPIVLVAPLLVAIALIELSSEWYLKPVFVFVGALQSFMAWRDWRARGIQYETR